MNRLQAIWLAALGAALVAVAVSGRAATGSADIAITDRANAYVSIAATGDFTVVVWGASTEGRRDGCLRRVESRRRTHVRCADARESRGR